MRDIRNCRKKAGLSQADTAKALGVAQTAVSQWERGLSAPRYARLQQLARLFKCSVNDLVGDTDENTTEDGEFHG